MQQLLNVNFISKNQIKAQILIITLQFLPLHGIKYFILLQTIKLTV